MSERKPIPRAAMLPAERRARSRLAQLVHGRGLLRGNLLQRQRVCGKPNCKCARGARHVSLYLVFSQGGRLRQLCVPKAWEPRVRQWVRDYHNARQFLEAISRLYYEKVRQRQD